MGNGNKIHSAFPDILAVKICDSILSYYIVDIPTGKSHTRPLLEEWHYPRNGVVDGG